MTATVIVMTSVRPRWGAVTVDCVDPDLLAGFWAAMLGTTVRGRWEQYVSLQPIEGQPVLAFQRVPDKSAGRNTVHLDLHVADVAERDEEVKRAVALGGRHIDSVQQADANWVVLTDPEGNRFCIVAA